MKLGIILSRVPYPLEKGDKLRAFHQLKELSKRHEIYLCAVNVGRLNKEAIEKIKPYCKEIKIIQLNHYTILFNLIHGLLFTKLPLQITYFFKKSAKKSVLSYFKDNKVQHIFCQLIRVSEYVKEIDEIPKTLDYMDALSRGMERRIFKSGFIIRPFVRLEALRLKQYEHFILPAFDYKTIISEQDRELIIHVNNQKIEVIRNGVDREFFHPIETKKTTDLLFTGNMSYPPNVEGAIFLVEKVLPIIQHELPEIKVSIVGANPNPKVQRLASKNVFISGWVDDIRIHYAEAKVFAAPMLLGTGLQNKLLEAMAMKIPCITTSLANNALNAIEDESILIAESPEEFSLKILDLLKNESKSSEIALAGYNFVKQNYDWESCTKKLEAIFENSIK
tara:strand:+ start:13913 stop:15088 length:1176 start_codon:yes stop_codon:yes gene_type:complete